MAITISVTQSVCPVCLRKLDAEIIAGDDGMIHMIKTCEEHGSFDVLLWEGDLVSYLLWAREDAGGGKAPVTAGQKEKGCPYDCGFCSDHQSDGCCVLLELTSRCSLHCPVCFASAEQGAGWDLPLEEIEKQYDWLMRHGGPYNIQLSGGEPTMRDDLDRIVMLGKEKGFRYFQLNTNGLRIAGEDGYAQKLKDMGISCVFLQFDGCRDETYRKLRGRDLYEIKCRAVECCKEAGLPVVLVPVIAPDVNEDEIGEILHFAVQRHPAVRGVHFQPLSYFGRCEILPREADTKDCNDTRTQWRITIPRMLDAIEQQTGGLMKAADFRGGGTESPYCSFHAAYRLRPGGKLNVLQKRTRGCCAQPGSEAMQYVSQLWGNESPCFEELPGSDVFSLDQFLKQAVNNTFTVTGMLFQDAWNLDLNRLKRCYICEADSEHGMVPFCAYNLTDCSGKALYRK